jgi:hypothetical protein
LPKAASVVEGLNTQGPDAYHQRPEGPVKKAGKKVDEAVEKVKDK